MTGKEFYRAAAKGKADILQAFLELAGEAKAPFCVIGGLAVNAYAEPVVSLDLDVVVAAGGIAGLRDLAKSRGFSVETFSHSVNLTLPGSDVRVQLQTDPRYQGFLSRCAPREVLGSTLPVAALEDVLQGKLWAYADPSRRASRRQKDLADILRLAEAHPPLAGRLPPDIRDLLD